MEDKRPLARRHSAFFDLERDPRRAALTQPQSLLKTTEWGGLTLLSLVLGWAFPPYFISVMTLAFLNAGGLLWVTHLSEAGRRRLREFETEFAKGHALEEAGRIDEAVAAYEALVPRFQDHPKIAEIARHRISYLRAQVQAAPLRKARKAAKAKAAPPRRPSRKARP